MNYQDRLPGENITKQCQLEAYKKVDKKKRWNQILEDLYEHKEKYLTAKQISNNLFKKHLIPTNERNFVAPRLTELKKMGKVTTGEKVKCEWTGKMVTSFRIVV